MLKPISKPQNDNEADLRLLGLANTNRKLALVIGGIEPWAQDALERAINNDLIILVDVSPIASHPGAIFRIFKLTEAGEKRLSALRIMMQ